MPTALLDRLERNLHSRTERGLFRQLTSSDVLTLIDFSSNDYLSLGKSVQLKEKLVKSLEGDILPYGPASSRLLDGNSQAHAKLENDLAEYFGGQSALLFNSGFDANVSIFSVLLSENDVLLYDELIHASTHDGMRQSRCKRRLPFRHNSVQDLSAQLETLFTEQSQQGELFRKGNADVFVAVEGLYSMDGDLVPLPAMIAAIEAIAPMGNCHLVVDEAHSTGLYGPFGRGLTAHYKLEDKVLVRLQTFGKAWACGGAVVLAHPTIRSYLINYARPLIFSTSLSRLNIAAIQSALDYLKEGLADEARSHLHSLSFQLLNRLRAFLPSPIAHLPPDLADPSNTLATPIIPIITNQPRQVAIHLNEAGFLVRPICYPTVPRKAERIRICLHAANTFEEVDGLAEALKQELSGKTAKL